MMCGLEAGADGTPPGSHIRDPAVPHGYTVGSCT